MPAFSTGQHGEREGERYRERIRQCGQGRQGRDRGERERRGRSGGYRKRVVYRGIMLVAVGVEVTWEFSLACLADAKARGSRIQASGVLLELRAFGGCCAGRKRGRIRGHVKVARVWCKAARHPLAPLVQLDPGISRFDLPSSGSLCVLGMHAT